MTSNEFTQKAKEILEVMKSNWVFSQDGIELIKQYLKNHNNDDLKAVLEKLPIQPVNVS